MKRNLPAFLTNLLIILFYLNTNTSQAQLTSHDGYIQTKFSIGSIDRTSYMMPAIAGEYFLKRAKNLTLNYNFEYMIRRDSITQFHTSLGTAAGPIWLVLSLANGNILNPKYALAMSALLFIMPDGVSYHIPIKFNWDIAPYANLLGFDFIKNKQTGERHFKYATSFGVKGTYYHASQFTLFSFIETRNTLFQGWSWGGGIGIGYAFNINKEVNLFNRDN
jgi:hypothetical protein